jgi:hypothetical protein
MRRESFRELIDDVHHLPETQRTALLLREIDALSYEQIAHAMETTIPSVKSLLVRARISLAEAAEARNLSCDDVRLELGEAAEGLTKLTTPARRHVRTCERCSFFKKQLKDNNHALALILPVGPLLLLKKLLLAKLGSTASAGGAHVAGGAGAVGATVGAGAVATTGGSSVAGGLVTAGAGALATKAVAGLAAAAIVTAGAVAAGNAVAVHHHHPHAALTASVPASHYTEPVVIHQALQPVSAGGPPVVHRVNLARQQHHAKAIKTVKSAPVTPVVSAAPVPTTVPATTPAKPADPQPTVQVTEVTTNTTTLPAGATATPSTTTAPTTTTAPPVTTPTTTTEAATEPAPTTETPVTPPTEPGAPQGSSSPQTPPPVNVTGGTPAPATAPSE